MNAPANITALDQVRAMYRKLSQADQLSIMCDLIQGGHRDLNRSDAFIDALMPVDKAFDDAWDELKADSEGYPDDGINPSLVHPDNPAKPQGYWA